MLTFADMGGRRGQGKSDMLTQRWGKGNKWTGENYLYACFLLNKNIQLIKSLKDSWGVGAWGLWQYKSFQFNLIVYWVKHPAVSGVSTYRIQKEEEA